MRRHVMRGIALLTILNAALEAAAQTTVEIREREL